MPVNNAILLIYLEEITKGVPQEFCADIYHCVVYNDEILKSS